MKKNRSTFFMSRDVLALLSLVLIVLIVGIFSLFFQEGFFNSLNMSHSTHIQEEHPLAGQATHFLKNYDASGEFKKESNEKSKEKSSDDIFCSQLKKLYSIEEKPLDTFYFSKCS